jgi:DNA-binding CsgD family transcriptional regulator
LDAARQRLIDVRRRCVEHGAERLLMSLSLHSALVEIWAGKFDEAEQVADDAMELAQQIGGDQMFAIGSTIRAAVAAHTGNEGEARDYVHAALEHADRCEARSLSDLPTAILGFLEVSLGNYTDALNTLRPLLSRFDANPCSEMVTASFLPDAIEAMIGLGQLDEAEPLIEALEHNGQWLDRPWMLAVGARCRSMWLAARGDVAAADIVAQRALHEHERLPMPFERTRTELLVGQLSRRLRRKDSATALHTALHAFESLGSELWAQRVRAEIERTRATRRDVGLTGSELRVAELAASGMTNRDVAAKLFISPKTVEHNLARAYRKLGIHSRAELGQQMTELASGDSTEPCVADG